MKYFYSLLEGLAWLLCLLGLVLAFAGCAATAQLPVLTRADTVLTAAGVKSIGKLVVRGNLTIQTGTGNSVTGKDKTGQRAQALSTGANSPVTATSKKAGLPWWVFAGLAALCVVGGFLLRGKLKIPLPF